MATPDYSSELCCKSLVYPASWVHLLATVVAAKSGTYQATDRKPSKPNSTLSSWPACQPTSKNLPSACRRSLCTIGFLTVGEANSHRCWLPNHQQLACGFSSSQTPHRPGCQKLARQAADPVLNQSDATEDIHNPYHSLATEGERIAR